jgi:signal peptidase II
MATKNRFSAKPKTSLTPWLGIAAIVILFDQLSKITVNKMLHLGEERIVTSFFNLTLAYNRGAAFSFLGSESGWQRYLFTAIGIGAAGYIIYLLKKHAGQRLFCWALALILGGAIGNVIDRLIYGHVIDFLDFHHDAFGHFPAFNLADSAITLGAALFILDELRRVNR